MKKTYLLGLATVLFFSTAWILFISYVNSRTTKIQVQVSGNVDEVRFFRVDNPSQPVAVVKTDGKDTKATVELRNSDGNSFLTQDSPALYDAVLVQGNKLREISKVCCVTGLLPKQRLLIINSLSDWQVSSP